MAFQASVGTWFAVHMLARLPVGGRFGINNVALPVSLRLETGVGLDDIEVLQSDRGSIHVQCKTSASLSTGATAPLAKTIAQLAQWTAHEKTARGLPDLTRNVGIMAVKADASGTLDNLEAGCRAFDLGGAWAQTHAQRNKSERHALDVFRQFAISGWTESQGTPPTDTDIVDMARLFRITRFSMDEGQSDWREASQLLGRHVYGSDAAGEGALRDLIGIIRALIGSGAPADREGLIRALRQRGHQDTGAPLFEADLQRLEAATATELGRLAAHGKLPLGVGVTITRESDAPLLAAIRTGSLLVVGEPGAGKTGALLHAAHALRAAGEGVVFLSVDRFPGVSIAADLSSELGLGHSLAQVLEATPGAARKFLFIDALDAARGGAAEVVFSSVIQDVKSRLHSQWTVVASMRTFDLRNGRRFKEAFEGAFADSKFADSTLLAVRHFHIPRLSQRDLQTAASGSAELAALLSAAPVRLRELLGNVFNLSLAAQLLATGTEPSAFNGIRTQSGLIDAYEDARLPETALARAAGATASAMLARRQLSVRKVAVNQERLDDVIRAGVLTESGDLVSFAHHVLFDHVLARFHLPWDEPGALVAQLSADSTAALLLAPALRFAVERVWRSDNPNRSASWALLFRIYSASAVDPVLGSVAVRVAVENVNTWEDLGALGKV